jgi:restriction system protein
MLWPTLQALKLLGDSASIAEIEDKVIEITGLSEEQLQERHGDGPQTEVQYRLAWARTYLKKVDAVTNTNRGVWAITEAGTRLNSDDMVDIPGRVRAQSAKPPDGRTEGEIHTEAFSRVKADDAEAPHSESDRQHFPGDATFTSTDPEQWSQFLLEALLSVAPATFEKLCQRVLRESGFTKVDVTGRSGDGGIDGIGVLRVSLLSFHVYFQCKRYRGSVGASAIRDFRGAMVGRTDKGLFITTGTFTPDAKREATRDGAPVLDLIDGAALCVLLKDLNLGISTQMVEAVTVDSHWFQAL